MDYSPPFIQSIQIHKVRHLHDIFIPLDESRPRHLILTGPNGSGKTSVLCFIKDYLEGIHSKELFQTESWKINIDNLENQQRQLESSLAGALSEEERTGLQNKLVNTSSSIQHFKNMLAGFDSLTLKISGMAMLADSHAKGEYLLGYFEARRTAQIQPVTGAQKLDLPKNNPIETSQNAIGSRFLQFLVNQENRAALLLRKGDMEGVKAIQNWMDKITAKFRDIFQNEQLKLEYDIDNFDFLVSIPGREPFRLINNQLSDGFSSIIQIVAELLLRMEAVTPGRYEVPGIVLIDGIETHLHIRLQKIILPFLVTFFPHIQFIVTTHSPFILTSLNDAIVFDLESLDRRENMAPMAVSTVIEDYFDLDQYSDEIKNMIARYKILSERTELSIQESEELETLRKQLDPMDNDTAPELASYYRHLRAREAMR
jgi:predicted ATP-binding protein involved in virulence